MKNIKYYYDLEQGTEEWLKARLGIVTASIVNVLITPTGKLAKGQKIDDLAYSLAIQREAGFIEEHYESFDMMRGHFQEIIARDCYSENIEKVTECGFITREFESFKIGCSPDGLVSDSGGIEIKSRLSKFQIKTIIEGEIPDEYMNQIQCSLLVSDREWWHFIQYSNGLPLFVKRVLPDLKRQDLIIEAVASLEIQIQKFQEIYRENCKKLIKTEWVDFNTDDVILASGV